VTKYFQNLLGYFGDVYIDNGSFEEKKLPITNNKM